MSRESPQALAWPAVQRLVLVFGSAAAASGSQHLEAAVNYCLSLASRVRCSQYVSDRIVGRVWRSKTESMKQNVKKDRRDMERPPPGLEPVCIAVH